MGDAGEIPIEFIIAKNDLLSYDLPSPGLFTANSFYHSFFFQFIGMIPNAIHAQIDPFGHLFLWYAGIRKNNVQNCLFHIR